MPEAGAPMAQSAKSGWARVFSTLKFRVVLAAVASALLSGGVSTYFMSRETERVATMLFTQQQSDEVELVADMLHSKITQLQSFMRLLASELTPELLADRDALEQLLLGRPLARHLFESLFVARPDGQAVAGLSHGNTQRFPLNLLDRDYFLQTLSTGQPVVSPPVVNKLTGRMTVVFTMPLRSMAGDVYGVMGGTVPLESTELLPGTLSMVGQFESNLVVYTRDGLMLSHPDKSRVLQSVQDEPGLAQAHAEWIQDGRTLFTEGVARLVPGYMVTMAGVPSAQWMVARVTSERLALAPMREVQQRSWAIIALIMGLCAASAAGLIVWMTQPISRLRDRAEQLRSSDAAPEEGWPVARGEIGDLVRVFREVTIERAKAHQAGQVMVGQLRAILQHASIGILITRNRRFELVGRHMTQMLGYTEEEMLGQPARMIYPSDEAYDELGRRVAEQMAAHGHFDGEVLFRRKDGSEFWGQMLGRGLNPNDPMDGTIWIMHDVTAAREARRQLSWSATHDSLTQLVNRREFESRLMQAMVQFDFRDVCLMYVDLDHFKPINDTAGHATGDDALRQIAQLLEAQVRQSDTVARLGGDEFAVLLPGCSLQRARELAEQIRQSVRGWRLVHKTREFQVSASIGIVELTPGLPDIASVLHAADMACYKAKNDGRDRVVVYDATMARSSTRNADI